MLKVRQVLLPIIISTFSYTFPGDSNLLSEANLASKNSEMGQLSNHRGQQHPSLCQLSCPSAQCTIILLLSLAKSVSSPPTILNQAYNSKDVFYLPSSPVCHSTQQLLLLNLSTFPPTSRPLGAILKPVDLSKLFF